MKDSQLIDWLASTDVYRDDVALPEMLRPDFALLETTRRMSMDTKERVQTLDKERSGRRGVLAGAAAFAIVLLVGLAVVALSGSGADSEPVSPPTSLANIDVNAADPIQAHNDQASRVTVTFAGDAQALFEGGAYIFDLQLDLEGSNDLNPGVSLNIVSTDGVAVSAGTSPTGNEVLATWTWPSNDKVIITLTGRGIGIPDTRPAVVVTVKETPSSTDVVFVMDAPAG